MAITPPSKAIKIHPQKCGPDSLMVPFYCDVSFLDTNMLKLLKVFFIAIIIFSLIGCTNKASYAERKQFLYIEQEQAGYLVTVSVLDRGSDGYVAISGLGKATGIDKNISIEKSEFTQLWENVNSNEISQYKHEFSSDESTTGLTFYTINVIDNAEKHYLKVPIKGMNEHAKKVIRQIKSYVKN